MAKAALVGAKMVAGAMVSTVSCVMLAAVTAATSVENLSGSAARVASSGAEPVGETVTTGVRGLGVRGGVRGL